MHPPRPSGAAIFGRIILLIGGLCLSILGMVAFALWWGSADGVVVLMLGLLVFCLVGGPLLKRYFERHDRA